MSTFKQSLRLERSCSQELSTFKQTAEPDPWIHFSWKAKPKFNKIFTWTDELRILENTNVAKELATAKNAIETCGPQYIWNFAKKIINPYELVYTYKKDNIPKSLSMHIPLSRSYFKMIEILQLTGYFTKRTSKMSLSTAHVCEGPGGFIEAIYEIASRNSIKIKNTHAITLRSTQPHIPGWRRAQQFLQRHRQVKIEYGPDNTGDILIKENRDDFIRKTGKVNIYTADGGFDFTADYLAQEKSIFPLIVASAYIGFSVLDNNGFFVLKIFDQFEIATQQLIIFMSSLFDQWTIYKPATSRPCNSEQYFIGYGFRGIKRDDLVQLEHLIEFGVMPQTIFDDIDEYIHNSAMTTQIDFLQRAQGLVTKWHKSAPTSDELEHLWNYVLQSSIKFCKLFKIYHYQINELACELRLPKPLEDDESTYCGVDLKDEIVEAKSSLPNSCQQSLKPDAVSSSHDSSVPTSESCRPTDSDLPLPKSS